MNHFSIQDEHKTQVERNKKRQKNERNTDTIF